MRKKYFITLLLVLSIQWIFGQQISTIDIVKVNAKYEQEAMYFYTENWQAFRKHALSKEVIASYELKKTAIDSTNHFFLILITTYKDSVQMSHMEENFAPIMKAISPNGPKMLNSLDRKQFLEYVSGYDAATIISSQKKKKKKS